MELFIEDNVIRIYLTTLNADFYFLIKYLLLKKPLSFQTSDKGEVQTLPTILYYNIITHI